MKWATRAAIHIDRAASAWLISRYVDDQAEFIFVTDPADIPPHATAFDITGADLSHHGGDCTFETILRTYDLTDPVLWRLAGIVHQADLEDDTYDAPEAPGLDLVLHGLAVSHDDHQILAITGPIFDGIYQYCRDAILLGRDTA
jgi:hypothetical protein